jgi:hypothetical protein
MTKDSSRELIRNPKDDGVEEYGVNKVPQKVKPPTPKPPPAPPPPSAPKPKEKSDK